MSLRKLKYFTHIRLKKMTKIMKLRQQIRCADRTSKQLCPE